jgi:pimeloyl-ACP methyl ester carboxylesterase
MKQVFFLSGLGADRRVFNFLDLPGHELNHVVWVAPIRGETITEYARRLLPQIHSDHPIVVGVSFGGMIALEIASMIKVDMVILISSARSPEAIPRYLKLMARLNIQKFLKPKPIRKPNAILFWLFGVTKQEHKTLLTAIMTDTDEAFFAWAIESVRMWKGNVPSCKVIQIHGTRDRVLTLLSADYIVPRGGHLMIVTNAGEISQILQRMLNEPS